MQKVLVWLKRFMRACVSMFFLNIEGLLQSEISDDGVNQKEEKDTYNSTLGKGRYIYVG